MKKLKSTHTKMSKYSDQDNEMIFIDIFEIIIKNIIIPYFIDKYQFSNDSIELNSLLLCCKSIKKSFSYNFKSRYQYMIDDLSELVALDNIKHIKFGFEFNHHLDPGVFPRSLISLTFGYKFNQPL